MVLDILKKKNSNRKMRLKKFSFMHYNHVCKIFDKKTNFDERIFIALLVTKINISEIFKRK